VRDESEARYVNRKSGIVENSEDIAAVASNWAKSGPAYFPTEESTEILPAGQYSVEYSHMRGIYFKRKQIVLDDLIMLPDSVSEEITQNIEMFWTKKEQYRSMGFLWKRGVLLYGPPGGGKTSTLQMIAHNITNRGGLAIFVKDPQVAAEGLGVLRNIEPERPIIVMMEDFDTIQEKHGEGDLLAMLDGDLQVDNVVFIATTNYPEELDARIVNRPGRFDLVRRVGLPSAASRQIYFETMNPRLKGTKELKQWVKYTHDYTIAYMKELIVSVELLGQDFKKAVKALDAMRNASFSSKEDADIIPIDSVAGSVPTPAARTPRTSRRLTPRR